MLFLRKKQVYFSSDLIEKLFVQHPQMEVRLYERILDLFRRIGLPSF